MRIVICEDSVLLREGLVRLLVDSGHDVVAALPDASQLIETIDALAPELCIVDVRLPPTYTAEGLRAALEARRRWRDLPVIVLSQYVEERYASELVSAPGGALGYLLKDRVADVGDFIESVQLVAHGTTVLDPEVVAQLLNRSLRDERMKRLTEREQATLALIAEGKSNQAIAKLLHVTEARVEKYVTAIFHKLDLEPDESGNRRVLAVLAHLDRAGARSRENTTP